MNVPVQEFDEPQPEWLKVFTAATAFAPNYLKTHSDRRRALRSEAAEFFRERQIKANFASWGDLLTVRFLGVSFTIDADYVSLMDFDPDDNSDIDSFPEAKFWVSGDDLEDFRNALIKRQVFGQFEKAAGLTNVLAYRILRMFSAGLTEAIHSNAAIVWARPRSPLNPFRRILPDQYRHFHIIDCEAGTAEGPIGERLWSVHVQPVTLEMMPGPTIEIAAPAADQGASNSSAMGDCIGWFVELIRSSPENPSHTKDELLDEGLSRWGNKLSKRKIEHALMAAKQKADAPAWSKPGPRPRTSKSVRRIK